jgi:hypothetical protein
MSFRRNACLCILAAWPALAAPAWAEQIVLKSAQPYWKVGARDSNLSRACSLGRFSLLRSDKQVARFTGKIGAATLGIGLAGSSNLFDPDHLARPNEAYFFRAANTTSCEVFVGGRGNAASGARR